jgi:hypothetical protein
VAERADIAGFFLEPAPQVGDIDLAALPVKVESCFAPLFAALMLADQGGQPSSRVFATGQELDGGGIGAVEGIPAKIGAVASLGIEGAVVFVPAVNLAEALEATRGNPMAIRAFPRSIAIREHRHEAPSGRDQPCAQSVSRRIMQVIG